MAYTVAVTWIAKPGEEEEVARCLTELVEPFTDPIATYRAVDELTTPIFYDVVAGPWVFEFDVR